MKKLIISIVLVNFLAACASEQPLIAKPADPAPEVVAQPESATASEAAPVVTEDAFNDPGSILAKRSVYFSFDVSAVQDAEKPLVQAHAKYMSEHADRRVRLEGNADERGSNEYNLALGQRRAESVKKMLVLGGAKSSQIEAVSYGEEKPVALGHKEESWMLNRRVDIKYQ